MGNMGAMINYINDEVKSYQEVEYLKVFNEIPHKVMYKTYPAFNRRYTDIDPIITLASKMNNITVFEKSTDMRYLLGEFRVIITTHATSTLSWALLSGKPVIFIDNPDLAPLKKNVYSLMKKSVFLFDRREVDMLSKLKEFLLTSIENIEYEWSKEYRVTARK